MDRHPSRCPLSYRYSSWNCPLFQSHEISSEPTSYHNLLRHHGPNSGIRRFHVHQFHDLSALSNNPDLGLHHRRNSFPSQLPRHSLLHTPQSEKNKRKQQIKIGGFVSVKATFFNQYKMVCCFPESLSTKLITEYHLRINRHQFFNVVIGTTNTPSSLWYAAL